MNILRPANLKRNDLLRLASSLSKHGVTEIVIHRGCEVQHLRATNARKWQTTQIVGSEIQQERNVTIPPNFH